MRNLKKYLLLTSVFAICFISVCACGRKNTGIENSSESSTQEETVTVETEYDTFEEYLENNPYELESLNAVAQSNGATVECEGNSIIMTTVLEDISEGDVEMYAEIFEATFSAQSIQEEFDDLKQEMIEETGYNVTIICRYETLSGTCIYEAVFE